jgi:hypothetical protein
MAPTNQQNEIRVIKILEKALIILITKTKFYLIFTSKELSIIKSQHHNAHSSSRKYSGKTTLTRLLAKHFKWEPHFEDVVDNPYLMILPSNGKMVI